MYCPIKSEKGKDAIYSQQLCFLKKCPIQAFWNDLAEQEKSWQAQGDQLFTMGDWNRDAIDDDFFEWRDQLGLCEAIIDTHGEIMLQAPTTEEIDVSTGL